MIYVVAPDYKRYRIWVRERGLDLRKTRWVSHSLHLAGVSDAVVYVVSLWHCSADVLRALWNLEDMGAITVNRDWA